jgi:putative PIN family toxin of toxin-antitoxin system
MARVTADTNIYVSAVMFGGLPGTFLDLALIRAFTLVTSPTLLDELDETLRGEKFKLSAADSAKIRTKLESVAAMTIPVNRLDAVPDDPDDNRVLECAVEGQADYIVSGDRHLLALGSFDDIPILTVRQFLNQLDTDG